MSVFINLIGQRFTRLKVIEKIPGKPRVSRWRCICDCGNIHDANSAELKKGKTKSCGCLRKELAKENVKKSLEKVITHGLANHRFYHTWHQMNKRCNNPKCNGFENYGGRGIIVCDEWKYDPVEFLTWCDSQESIPKGYTLDRINTDDNYRPENCRFVSMKEQERNRRNNRIIEYNGEKMCFTEFVEKYGLVSLHTARTRIRRGWNFREAALRPLR